MRDSTAAKLPRHAHAVVSTAVILREAATESHIFLHRVCRRERVIYTSNQLIPPRLEREGLKDEWRGQERSRKMWMYTMKL